MSNATRTAADLQDERAQLVERRDITERDARNIIPNGRAHRTRQAARKGRMFQQVAEMNERIAKLDEQIAAATQPSRIPAELRQRILKLTEALGPLANDAAQIHYDLRAEGEWGTGVTRGIEAKLVDTATRLHDLLAADAQR